ncbi:Disulfide bond formation protein D precursor [Pseudoruegeria aquimaris]|uniref:Disulfide bond formation protein D n=1 Tax=Pseudoruegeria aquimaris TaxID=393663 RepID=A0A1Y5TM78_9RHOB|nr:DsbA family protein [Pseudoruegeria aquimaris]SLN67325.1 Disulfide bond formation protein D precursor [Pseudoruegeria aquimaris]
MQRKLALAAAAVALLTAGAAWVTSNTQQTAAGFSAPFAAANAQETQAPEIVEMVLGEEDAPITVIEYASYTCPHCANFHKAVYPQLKKNYIDTGKVKFIYREVYFDRFGLWASMVARCGGEMRFFGITDLIYAGQKEWTSSGDPATIAQNLRKIGLTAGIPEGQLDACMQDADMAQALVGWFEENAKADDINSTPSFIIDGKKVSNMNYADFSALLDEKLGE